MQRDKLPTVDELSSKINNTLVSPETTLEDLTRFVLESKTYGFEAVVIQGCWVKEVKELLRGSPMKVSVGVGYPMGGERTETKLDEIKQTAALAFRGSPTQAPVIGPHGEVLYGAAAATYLHHRGLKKGVPYTVPRYHSEEWHRRRELATRHARSR
jgi:hypothetical protein